MKNHVESSRADEDLINASFLLMIPSNYHLWWHLHFLRHLLFQFLKWIFFNHISLIINNYHQRFLSRWWHPCLLCAVVVIKWVYQSVDVDIVWLWEKWVSWSQSFWLGTIGGFLKLAILNLFFYKVFDIELIHDLRWFLRSFRSKLIP